MSNIGLVASSDILLTDEQISKIRESGVPLEPVHVIGILDGKEYFDMSCLETELANSITNDEYYKYMIEHDHNSEEFPSTSQPNQYQFSTAIEKVMKEVDNVYVFPILPSRSGTLNSALQAAISLTDIRLDDMIGFNDKGYYTGNKSYFEFKTGEKTIFVINTKTASAGIGHEVWNAWLNRGRSRNEILSAIDTASNEIYIGVSLSDPRYFAKRYENLPPQANSMIGKLATLTKLRVLVNVENGILKPKIKRSEKKLKRSVTEDLEELSSNLGKPLDIWVLNTGDVNFAKMVGEEIAELPYIKTIHYSTLTPPIGTYIGPNRYGLVALPSIKEQSSTQTQHIV